MRVKPRNNTSIQRIHDTWYELYKMLTTTALPGYTISSTCSDSADWTASMLLTPSRVVTIKNSGGKLPRTDYIYEKAVDRRRRILYEIHCSVRCPSLHLWWMHSWGLVARDVIITSSPRVGSKITTR